MKSAKFLFSDIQKRISMNVKDAILDVLLYYQTKPVTILDKKYIKIYRPNHPTNCLHLDLVKIKTLELKGLRQIKFDFKNLSEFQVEIQLEDRQQSLSRAFKYNKFKNSGSRMNLKNLTKNKFNYYAVAFHQNIFVENDPARKCKEYQKESYDDCDSKFIAGVLEKNYPPGFLPIWATNDLTKVTKMIYGQNYSFSNAFTKIITGSAVSDCPLPCTTTEIKSVFLDTKFEKNMDMEYSRIDIEFSDKVTVTMTDFPKFNPAVFLSALGGSMGFWLGWGMVQTFEMMVHCIFKIFRYSA